MRMRLLSLLAVVWASQVLAEIPVPPQPPPPPPLPETGGSLEEAAGYAQLNIAESSVISLVNRIGRTYKLLNIATLTLAGDLFQDVTVLADMSYASFHDEVVGGSGHERTASLYLAANMGDEWSFGLGISQTRYSVGGPLQLLQHADTIEGYALYHVTTEFSLGGFVQYTMHDIEDSKLADGSHIGDSFTRWAGGVLGSYRKETDIATFGVTSSVASFNKQSPYDWFNNRDSAWITVFDVARNLTDNLVVDVYATYYTLLEHQDPGDGSYWLVGMDLIYQFGESWLFSIGYETDVAYNDYREHRLNATIGYQF
jgi:hypothetical protein